MAAEVRRRHVGPPLDGRLLAYVCVWLPRGKTVKSDYPVAGGDIDNYVKALLDGVQAGRGIVNDSRVSDITAVKRWATSEQPSGALVRIWRAI